MPEIRLVDDHVEVYMYGVFIFSDDTEEDAMQELRAQMTAIN